LSDSRDAGPLVWLSGGDHLNVLTLLGQRVPTLLELVALELDVRAFDPLQTVATMPELSRFERAPVLVLETLPLAEAGSLLHTEALQPLVNVARTAILLGTPACYGADIVPKAAIASFAALCKEERTPLIKLPGIPVPPQHLVGTLGHLAFFGFPQLDVHLRPTLYYGETLCTHCEFRGDLEQGRFADAFGAPGCLLEQGCKGLVTHNSCSRVGWNERENWCVGAGGACTGCSEPSYPEHDGVGLYGNLTGSRLAGRGGVIGHLSTIGTGLVGLTAVGMGLRVAADLLLGRPDADGQTPGGGRD
jgi:hydrogenase small subunit